MVLEVPSKLTSDAIDKSLGVLKVFLEKYVELWPRDQNNGFVVALVIGLSEADGAMEDRDGKKGIIHLCSV